MPARSARLTTPRWIWFATSPKPSSQLCPGPSARARPSGWGPGAAAPAPVVAIAGPSCQPPRPSRCSPCWTTHNTGARRGAKMITVLYPETLFPDDIVERDVFGPDVQILVRSVGTLAELDAADCESGHRPDRACATTSPPRTSPASPACAPWCAWASATTASTAPPPPNAACWCATCPTTAPREVADHAMALVLALRRGILLYHDTQRGEAPGPLAPGHHAAGPPARHAALRHHRAGTHRHRRRAAGESVRLLRRLLRPLPPERHRTRARHRPRPPRWRRCWNAPTC